MSYQVELINAKEDLPKKRQRVLLYHSIDSYVTATFVPNYSTEKGEFEDVFIGDNKGFYSVAHNSLFWMALPEPEQNNFT